MKLVPFIITLILWTNLAASKVVTNAHSNWSDPLSWKDGVVPVNPDTIVITHYITFTASLSIVAPTVLIIENEGTLCGDHFLDIECGARLINKGHMYINSGKLRDGENYNYFSAKTLITVVGCSLPGYGKGFFNVNATTEVWPPVLCRTPGTNWNRDVVGVSDYDQGEFSLYPNPTSSGIIFVRSSNPVLADVFNANGSLISTVSVNTETQIDLRDFPFGLYIIVLQFEGTPIARKVIRE